MLSHLKPFLRAVTTAVISLRGVVFAIVVWISSIHTFLQLVTVLLPLVFLSPRWFCILFGTVANSWHWFVVTLCEHLLGVKVVVTGTPPNNNRPHLILMNHRTRVDWMFYFCCHARYGTLGNIRVCLKESLKHVPGAGWGIQLLVFLFVRRRWDNDKEVFNRCIPFYFKVGLQPHILLFPEGTDFNQGSKEKSDKFAMKNNLPKYQYLLTPHTKGFTYIMEKLNQCSDLTEIVDVTVGYPYDVCQGETDLIYASIPQEAHFHVDTFPARSLPTNQEELETWCQDLWKKKEERLAHFYNHKSFPREYTSNFRSGRNVNLRKLLTALIWLPHIVLSSILVFYSPSIQIYYLFGICIYALSVIGFSGLDVLVPLLQTYHERWLFPKKQKD